jgi:hypothetical protein
MVKISGTIVRYLPYFGANVKAANAALKNGAERFVTKTTKGISIVVCAILTSSVGNLNKRVNMYSIAKNSA